ncbi:cyclic nucleotide-gated ion channel 1-like isoform X1 [Zingiber officinale]|uniref:cyclic nucleotide-gated ion channel 1-like isoform X1 n=1 Tax=Zingiber officinale TaxID=94328 RepID=UPI001C4AEDD9|nr:cyclic nucleotide-gated ion channel 1-like isoform X1 [Zingiber officinale]
MEVDLTQGSQLVYVVPDTMLTISDFYRNIQISILVRGYEGWQNDEANILVTRGMVGRLSNTLNVGFAYEIQNVVDYLITHGVRALPGRRYNTREVQGQNWIIHQSGINIPMQPTEVNTRNLLDGRVSIHFDNYQAAITANPPHYNQRDEEIPSDEEEVQHQVIAVLLQDPEVLQVRRISSTAIVPQRKTEGSAGYDLAINREQFVPKKDKSLLTTGICIQIPKGTYARIAPRSSAALRGLIIMRGVIDEDYRGEIVILVIMPRLKASASLDSKTLLMYIVILQYVPRLVRIIPLYLEVTRSAGIIAETAWAGAAFNLFLYMLASHVLGAFWYFLSIEREDSCWRHACRTQNCTTTSWYCSNGERESIITDFISANCPITPPNPEIFDFGIYLQALQLDIVKPINFLEKFFYCFWWGLQNLSALGQNMQTSTYLWEILFAVFVSISGLVLFSLLIGNMQTYLQSTTVRIEEMRVKRQDAEQWMSHRLLPENLRERIRRHEQYRWQETRGVDEEHLLQNLPKDLRRDIKRHLCLALLKRVPMFELMDDQLMDALCDCLKPVLYTEGSCIIREGDPVDEMLFIMRGKLLSVTTNGGRTGFFNSDYLTEGDFCGEELLTWALDPHSASSLPTSTRTVKAVSEVEAFALIADDLKFVASQFRKLHSKKLRHTFRFYSQQWRTWAACFIQAAWRRYSRKKLEESLREEEDRLQAAIVKDNAATPSLGATIYASRFAVNALRALRRNVARKARLQERLPVMLLQKPPEPDFTTEEQ